MGQPQHASEKSDTAAVDKVRQAANSATAAATVGNEGEATDQQPKQKTKEELEAEARYEEAMEDEYAKREGGA
jgi:hypothetical protein